MVPLRLARAVLLAAVMALVGGSPAGAGPSAANAADAAVCPDDGCRVDGGRYRVVVPPAWNGRDPLPVAVWFHGYRQDPGEVIGDRPLVAPFARRGVLLVVPEGAEGSWNFRARPEGRDEAAFAGRVLDDVRRRWPVDDGHVAAFGFSIGATMVWTLACRRQPAFTAHVAFSGTLWPPYPEHCPAGRTDLLHIHGTTDTVFPLAGRELRNGLRQGNSDMMLDFLRAEKSCAPAAPVPATALPAGLACRRDDCAGGGSVVSCRHGGGHWVEPAWVDMALGWMLTR
jgi:polyhydroxybutyrate depolymerase